MNYQTIYKCATSDGPGVRVSLYVSGCRNHCKGCHNPESWDFGGGIPYTDDTKKEVLDLCSRSYIRGLTICGGEPMEPENQEVLVSLLEEFHDLYPNKDVWCFTGYEFADLLPGGRKHTKYTDKMLQLIDAMIVGPFVLEQRDITADNLWRGSRNQRVIDVSASLNSGQLVMLRGIPNNE